MCMLHAGFEDGCSWLSLFACMASGILADTQLWCSRSRFVTNDTSVLVRFSLVSLLSSHLLDTLTRLSTRPTLPFVSNPHVCSLYARVGAWDALFTMDGTAFSGS
ncbi:hypothetical protein CONLIGDRAFT_465626 [Coniochaeta ligniaria NRRL 30616]|uniref:Uncharacterized protein n=1 Tax=Coniochaeta ligniaria NRRL 30616 TaxID=1408157 RepID=A0A1J7ILW1_9PEZI|nr:hypothetical protein CONLIGDRAFT_465626 [Coniochaeta ligniaria NRRL 30616]